MRISVRFFSSINSLIRFRGKIILGFFFFTNLKKNKEFQNLFISITINEINRLINVKNCVLLAYNNLD
jgi:hypothetical protein